MSKQDEVQPQNEIHQDTLLVQIGNRSETTTGTVSAPVYMSTAYRHSGIGESTGYDYTRTGNPTRSILEEAIAQLENGDRGFACSSGMSALQLAFSLFQNGDEIICSDDLYGGTYRLFDQVLSTFGIKFKYVDIRDPEQFRKEIGPLTKAIFLETPTNPLMQEGDLDAYAQICEEHKLLLIVDNTFYTPLIQKPLNHGAHIVVHSATKYLGGHNDILAGLVVTKGEELSEKMFVLHNSIGATLSAFDSWLLMRGMKTLALRMRQHEANALKVAAYLHQHKAVHDVLYPGKGGMLSFRIHDERGANIFLKNLRMITFAESLGGVESFITYPATQTHSEIPEEVRSARGVCNRLIRFSVGVEHIDDILADLEYAFAQMLEEVPSHE